ncbi:DUF3341 domain-containing protein [Bdellovibrio bacteriovorus]|uniref:DUF3341 domain-containing protein n=1 Tax=Bdellovibrio bacteriovorus TaxID=959 RepID=UPI003AA7C42E
MEKGHNSVFGIFRNRAQLENCVDRLKTESFRNSDISVLMPQKSETREFAHEKGTKAPEGASVGAGAGAVIGGSLGWLVGAGVIATIPALGPLVAAGPIMSALAGLGVGGAVGGLGGALVGVGIPEYEAKRYEGYVKDGGILISVHVDDGDWADKAERILKESGGEDISKAGEVRGDKSSQRDLRSHP